MDKRMRGKEVLSLFRRFESLASQFIGHDHARHILQTLQQPSKESFGCFVIPPRLNEDVEHHAVFDPPRAKDSAARPESG